MPTTPLSRLGESGPAPTGPGSAPARSGGPGVFVTTRWTQVVAAAASGGSPESEEALAALCQVYWFPLYAFIRRSGHGPEDAQDLTQAFFVRLLGERRRLAAADPARGRFRSYLLTMLKHFLADEWDRVRAQKRGPQQWVPLDTRLAEDRYGREPEASELPERVFERQWALTLLERVFQGLREEYVASGREAGFDRLRFALTGERSAVPYAGLARELGMTEGAVKVAVHRLRQRYRELLRAEIAQTVDGPAGVEAELRHLFRALAG